MLYLALQGSAKGHRPDKLCQYFSHRPEVRSVFSSLFLPMRFFRPDKLGLFSILTHEGLFRPDTLGVFFISTHEWLLRPETLGQIFVGRHNCSTRCSIGAVIDAVC